MDLGSVSFWASPDPLDFGPPGSVSHKYGSGSFHSSSKNRKKNLYFFCFVTSKDSCKCTFKKYGNKQKLFFVSPEGHWRKELDPDPLVRGTDPRIRILPKMSRIRNTDGFIDVVSCSVYSKDHLNKSRKYQFLNSAIFGPPITEERLDPETFCSFIRVENIWVCE